VVLLMLFAFVAGAGTALSPCVLPILPAVLGVGVTGGSRRPLGVVVGLALSFTFATVALVYVIEALGLPDDVVREIAIAVLLVFGFSLLLPPLSDRIEAALSRIAPAPARGAGDGFGSGLLLGGSLGFVYAPCAGPILAGVITVSASQDFTAGKLAVALSYAIGSAAVLYALMLGGRRVADRLKAYRGQVQIAMGAVMIGVAALMIANLDIRFQSAIADDLPAVLVNPTGELEESATVADRLASVHGGPVATEGGAAEADRGVPLPQLGAAPDFTATQRWFNTPGGAELSISELTSQGKVVLLDFWTYTCINCIRTLPYLKAWDSAYRDDGLVVVGVHSPEFAFEKEASNVEQAIEDNGLRYPVVQDNELGTWTAYGNQYWPAKYLVGPDGNVRYTHFGEGAYETTERAIRSLLAEAGADPGQSVGEEPAEVADRGLRTPETYLGFERAQGFVTPVRPGRFDYGRAAERLPANGFAYTGEWRVGRESAEAGRGAGLGVDFTARRVFLVMGSPGGPGEVEVRLDGRPISQADSGEDVSGTRVSVADQRLYRLVELPQAGRHRLSLRFAPGIEAYAFTFG
jgi:cytochrome c biogenesis protein CcdA/thiol-disulfide isomerase/thioredoxin